jgi:DNA-binding CsgD family transcriptional regulator
MTPLERRVALALRAGLRPEAIARLLRISVGKARQIAVKMVLERMNMELARSRVQLGDPA